MSAALALAAAPADDDTAPITLAGAVRAAIDELRRHEFGRGSPDEAARAADAIAELLPRWPGSGMLVEMLRSCRFALGSYGFGNGSPGLAKRVADAAQRVLDLADAQESADA